MYICGWVWVCIMCIYACVDDWIWMTKRFTCTYVDGYGYVSCVYACGDDCIWMTRNLHVQHMWMGMYHVYIYACVDD